MKIYLEGYFNCNLGDDLFFYMLLKRYKNVEFYTCTNVCIEYMKNLKGIKYNKFINKLLNFLHLNNLSTKQRVIQKMDAIVLLGGSMFIESKKKYDNTKYNYLFNCSKPYFIIGTNFGPYFSQGYYNNALKIFKNANDVTFRDNKSYTCFSSELSNVRMANDIIFSLKSKKNKKIRENKKAIISVINGQNRNFDENIYYNNLIYIYNFFKDRNYEICFKYFCEAEGDESEIVKIMNDINDEKAKKYFYRGNIEEALALINSADVVVGSRFHANILGIVYDKVVIPLAYSDKTIDALTDISFNGRIYDLRKNEKIILKDEDLIYKKNMFDDKSVNVHFEKLDNYLRRK